MLVKLALLYSMSNIKLGRPEILTVCTDFGTIKAIAVNRIPLTEVKLVLSEYGAGRIEILTVCTDIGTINRGALIGFC